MVNADELVLGNWRSQATTSGISVLEDREVIFPMVEVGTHRSKWITVKNPSHQPVVMQLILNSGEIIDECKDPDRLLQPSSCSSLGRLEHTTPLRYGFSMAEHAVTEAYVQPSGRASFGPIIFHPSSRCAWKSSALIRNNLSGVEWLPLRGFGGSLSLVLFEGSELLQNIEFLFNLPSFLNFSPPDMLDNVENGSHACSVPLSKEFYAKNVGDLPLEVSRIEVSGTECRLDGFIVHNCKGFALQPGESTKLMISYKTDFSAAMVQRDLELALPTGFLVIPMKASIPISMLNICKKSALWVRVKKSSVSIILVASIMYLLFYYILPITFGSQDYLLKGKSSIAILRHAGKSSHIHHNQKDGSKFGLFTKMNGLLRSMEEEKTLIQEQVNPAHAVNSTSCQSRTNSLWRSEKKVPSSSSLLPKSLEVESCDIQETSPPENLTVKIGKEKGRRRRKKKGSNTGLTGQLEVSSSQSGNSTPSSPLSPTTSLTPKRFLPISPNVDQCVDSRNPFTHVANGRSDKPTANALESKVSMKYVEKPSEPKMMVRKALFLPSATFPCTGRPAPNMMSSSPFLASTSTIAPHARAPGSKLYDGGAVKKPEGSGNRDEFKYDIWGDHLFGLRQSGRSKEVFAKSPLAMECNSDSFFVLGPQSQLKSVSSHQDG